MFPGHFSRVIAICEVADPLEPNAIISEVARRYGLRPQQVFAWRREACKTRRFRASGIPGLRAGCGDASERAPTRPAQRRRATGAMA
ncbi:transposase [Mesorhizobium sp.]|uniref:transposase n=1 Tax=Mesorhizobium sp. TaxID=1871066 RepID=UPI000FD294B7|nr:hypothetical protein EN779_32780 [Mesorhizobium sp. M4B.F.Ca.ET.088.02.2.1]RWF32506.1 MAG: hypothetical protein EOS45_07300 [Mesorhizobium sp.]